MKRFIIYIFNLALRCIDNQVFERATGLTYRILLAFFPFVIFLMSLVAFLDLNEQAIFEGLYYVFPGDIASLVTNFVHEIGERRSTGILSTALFFSVYNSSNGFRAIVRIANRAYGVRDERNIVMQVGISLLLMLLFSVMLIVMLGLLVFGREIWILLFPRVPEFLFSLTVDIVALVALTLITMLIYRLACATKLPIRHLLPGAVFTVSAWAIVSRAFGFVMSTFTQHNAIYGSIAGVFILILWLNVVAMILLIGNEANAVLREYWPWEKGKVTKKRTRK